MDHLLDFLWGFSGPLAHVFPRQFENLDLEQQGKNFKRRSHLTLSVWGQNLEDTPNGGDAVSS